MHGVHPKAKVIPITGAAQGPSREGRTANRCSRCSQGNWKAMTAPMATIRAPATSLRTSLCACKGCESVLAVASSTANTRLNPATNSSVDHSSRALSDLSGPAPALAPTPPTPDIIDRYEGTRGSTQGETNEAMPAPKAITKPIGECSTNAPAPPLEPVTSSTASAWDNGTEPLDIYSIVSDAGSTPKTRDEDLNGAVDGVEHGTSRSIRRGTAGGHPAAQFARRGVAQDSQQAGSPVGR